LASGLAWVPFFALFTFLFLECQSLTIKCKVSYSVYSYYTAWIRQPAGKDLEWIGYTASDETRTKDSVKSKISLSQDTSINTVYLRGQNFQTEDTAVYYCATHTHNDTTMQNSCTKTSSTTHCCPQCSSHSLSHTISPACLDYCTDWIRQPAGKALEWITTICGNGATDTKSSLRNKFSIARDSSSSTVTLSGQNLQTEDTAVYYCARRSYTVMQPSGGAVQKLIINTYSHIQHVKHTVYTSKHINSQLKTISYTQLP
uniref:Ig-like domain-containing protein n=1 Tax=Astyanax mexicanus TaxID=7994 RepID=A0A3B1IUX7_ASTMX